MTAATVTDSISLRVSNPCQDPERAAIQSFAQETEGLPNKLFKVFLSDRLEWSSEILVFGHDLCGEVAVKAFFDGTELGPQSPELPLSFTFERLEGMLLEFEFFTEDPELVGTHSYQALFYYALYPDSA